jgi:tryptophanyl-tRNA synthetase
MAKIRKAKTDAEPLPSEAAGLEGRPEARNLVAIYAAMADENVDQVLARFAGQGFGAFKPALGELLVETLRPIATRLSQLKADPAAIDAALETGAARAKALAQPTLDAAYAALGLCR